ncbi:hypothetical protein DLAC_07057 [Tieghemostelium lacteum]|uniref:Uncharacterized protein n=1 Tax=Tieghemostelium lacteum TaxID=361077 RepID=A0A151ZE37_TIELA|nr:hypothetical protein DLAC_07057 [Tieghemostelium lacteum]|eukprot:KYQ92211.1 hypothetical protein DLAC_07057 [Tieghemostelium lacteum]
MVFFFSNNKKAFYKNLKEILSEHGIQYLKDDELAHITNFILGGSYNSQEPVILIDWKVDGMESRFHKSCDNITSMKKTITAFLSKYSGNDSHNQLFLFTYPSWVKMIESFDHMALNPEYSWIRSQENIPDMARVFLITKSANMAPVVSECFRRIFNLK